MTETIQQHTRQSIDPGTEVGLLSLSVADLDRSLDFYKNAIGFQVLDQSDSVATLGVAGRPLLILSEQAGAAGWPRDRQSYTGLYHFAILLPSRADLGRWLEHWLQQGYPLPGQGDHLVSEALYLEDPDGHGIEIYRDRPRSEWASDGGQVRMGSGPVDLEGVLEEGRAAGLPWTGLPSGTKLGHIHLQAGSIPEAERFYVELLGFDVMAKMPSALFLAAGGYHHHIGLNTWHSLGSGPAPESTAKLRHFTIELPSEEARRQVIERLEAVGIVCHASGDAISVHDPFGNEILLRIRSS